jgi:multidrug resistance efflux pump
MAMRRDDDRLSDSIDRLSNRAYEQQRRAEQAEADLREVRDQRDQAWTDLANLKAQIRGIIGTAGAEATAIGDAATSGGWLTVVRVYAEALDTIGGLVDAERAVES